MDIICRKTKNNKHNFYLITNQKEYYLFTQRYRYGVDEYFRNGISYEKAQNRRRARGNHVVLKTMEKLPLYVAYAEKVYGITVLNKTKKRNRQAA